MYDLPLMKELNIKPDELSWGRTSAKYIRKI